MAEKKNPADEAGAAQLQATADEASEKGFYGTTPETKPNEEFTLRGVTSQK
jgi:hypothetical protein